MSTLNNKNIFLKTPYIQNQLIYNVPLQVYDSNGVLVNNVKIRAFKRDNNGLKVWVGTELLQNENFLVSTNNTANGIIITLFQNIPEAQFLQIWRYTNPQTTTEYQNSQNADLKQRLDIDFTNAFNTLQEDEKLLQDTMQEVGNYSSIITTQGNDIKELQENLITHTHRASKLIFDPIPNNQATTIQEAIENNTIAIMEAQRGNIDREAVRVATISNIDLQNITEIDGITLALNDRVLVKDQTDNRQNGVYVFNGVNALTRALDLNTLTLIQGSRVQVNEGTFAEKQFKLIANNLQAPIESEPILVEEQFYAITDNQIKLNNLAKQPAETFIANLTNTISEPQYADYTQVKTALELDNIDNTSDLNKPISTATQTALDEKVSQSDFDDFEADTQTNFLNFQTALAEKQSLLPLGGNNDYLGFENNEIIAKRLNINLIEGGENLNNTSDLEKPISNPQALVFDKCFQEKGNLETFDINGSFENCINLKSGAYYVSTTLLPSITDKPIGFLNSSKASLFLQNLYDGETKISQIQTLIEITNTKTFEYKREITLLPVFDVKEWSKTADNVDVATLTTLIENAVIGSIGDVVVTQPQLVDALALKQDLLPIGNATQYFKGDKTLGLLSTNAVIEADNLYFTQNRVRETILDGYTETNAITTSANTILEALGKKADRINVNNNKGNLKPQIVKSADFTLQASETGSTIAIIGSTIQNITLPKIDTQNNFCILYNQTSLEINLLKGTGITSISVPTIKPFESLTFFHDGFVAWKLVNALSYRKHEIDDKLNLKANQSTTYTKTEVDTALTLKANQSTTYTKTEVDGNIALYTGNLKPQSGAIVTNLTLNQSVSGRVNVLSSGLTTVTFPLKASVISGTVFILKNETGGNVNLVMRGDLIQGGSTIPNGNCNIYAYDGGNLYRLISRTTNTN